jgi:hypothetical protein
LDTGTIGLDAETSRTYAEIFQSDASTFGSYNVRTMFKMLAAVRMQDSLTQILKPLIQRLEQQLSMLETLVKMLEL